MSEEARLERLAFLKIENTERLRRLYSIKDPEERRMALLCDTMLCKESFFNWCGWYGIVKHEKIVGVSDATLVETPFDLWPSQVEAALWLLESLKLRVPRLIVKSRELGITILVIHILWWLWRFYGVSSHLMSKVEKNVDRRGDPGSLFEKLRFIQERQPPHLKERRVLDNFMTFKNLRNRGSISGSSTTPDSGRGDRRGVAAVDEFFAIPPVIAANMLAALEAVAATVWLFGTPSSGTAHPGYELYKRLSAEQVMTLDWRSDPYRDEDFPASKMLPPDGHGLLLPAVFRREYCCDFTAVVTGLIWQCIAEDVRYTDHDFNAAEARRSWIHFGGWDYGSGPSDLVCVFGLARLREEDGLLEIRLDNVLSWQQVHWYKAGQEALTVGSGYQGPAVHFGDPAGENRESDQTGWAQKLRSIGFPIMSLPAWFNSNEGKEWAIRETQLMLTRGQLLVHARCELVFAVLGQWRRNVPDGVDPRLFDRAYIPPKHDMFSHCGYAILYLIAGALSYFNYLNASRGSRAAVAASPMPQKPSDQMATLFRQSPHSMI